MNSKFKIQNVKWGAGLVFGCLFFNFTFLILNCGAAVPTNATPAQSERPPETPREFFNAGTKLLKAGKLREAEAELLTTLIQRDDQLQPAALYNLGQVRFAQGTEELKKAADGAQRTGRLRQATARANAAIQGADAALANNDVNRMVEAYQQGRGARKELNAATKAVRAAMEVFGNVLLRWQRAAGDFKSAAELNPADTNATRNADIVNQRIAWLIDQIREMQQAMAAAAQAKQQLGEKMSQLKGRIPAPDAPPGGAGEEEEEEEEEGDESPKGPQPHHEERGGKTGEEMKMSPEAAERMLNGMRRDGDRRMPMGQGEEGKPKDPKRPNW